MAAIRNAGSRTECESNSFASTMENEEEPSPYEPSPHVDSGAPSRLPKILDRRITCLEIVIAFLILLFLLGLLLPKVET